MNVKELKDVLNNIDENLEVYCCNITKNMLNNRKEIIDLADVHFYSEVENNGLYLFYIGEEEIDG